jgi:glucosyl-3-phosphoglycerate synthase
VVFMDADLLDWDTHFVPGLLGPLLTWPEVQLVKGFYTRPGEHGTMDGGRVTELVARPLLNLYWPELGQFVQPLAGEYAARRELLVELPFPTGYGVEIAMLVDLLGRIGIGGMAQVELGRRTHSHQSTQALGVMAAEVLGTALRRLDLEPGNRTLRQFRYEGSELHDRNTGVALLERPPAAHVARYVPPAAELLDGDPT